ncbi:hypothetical protein [Oceanobacillus sp. CF4.6]|uniref:hypothetical protein n=1 Tax=Oceanobacillus sp. CF4.6 TaxID=3373080 RepID=UPI003EE7D273
MEDLFFILFALSMLAFLVFIVLLLVKLIFKKGMALKRIFISMSALIGIMIISLINTPPLEEDVSANAKDEKPEQTEEVAERDNEDESTDQDKGEDDQFEAEKEKKQQELEEQKKEEVKESGLSDSEEESNDSSSNDSISQVSFDVYESANKNIDEVTNILGEGEKIEEGSFNSYGVEYPTTTFAYDDGAIEILFIDDVAGRITLTPKEDIMFADEEARNLFLAEYGFPHWLSSEETESVIYWENYGTITPGEGLHKMSMFSDPDGNVNYVYLITHWEFE